MQRVRRVPRLEATASRSDRTIPPFMAEKLYAAAPEPKQIALIPQANHNNLPEFGTQQYLATLQQFIQIAIGDRKFTPNSKINYSPSPQVPKSPSPQVIPYHPRSDATPNHHVGSS